MLVGIPLHTHLCPTSGAMFFEVLSLESSPMLLLSNHLGIPHCGKPLGLLHTWDSWGKLLALTTTLQWMRRLFVDHNSI